MWSHTCDSWQHVQCQGAIGNIRVQIPEAIGSCQFNAAKPNCEVFLSSDFKSLYKSLSLCLSFCLIFICIIHCLLFAGGFHESPDLQRGEEAGYTMLSRASKSKRLQTVQMFDSFHVAFAMYFRMGLYFCIFVCALQHCISFRPQVPSSMKPGEQAWQEHEKGWWPGNWK